MSMLRLSEATILDDADRLVTVWQVDPRKPRDRTPVATVVKACRRDHAIDRVGTIRVSKPAYFRSFGERLIRDPAETLVSRSVVTSERIDDPDDMAEAQRIDEELNQCAAAIGKQIDLRTRSVQRRSTSTSTWTYGKNGWIYCTSFEPRDEEETRRWKSSLPVEYYHLERIPRPREFARALGLMVAEQLGPRGPEQTIKHASGAAAIETRHKDQLIVHGPVVYSVDPFELVSSMRSPLERMLMAALVKHTRYAEQREYRFLIWSEEEPTEEYVDLTVSKAMLGSLEILRNPPRGRRPATGRAAEPPKSGATEAKRDGDGGDRAGTSCPRALHLFLKLADDPSTRLVPSKDASRSLFPIGGAAAAEAALAALRRKVDQVEGDRRAPVASAAWHAEPFIRTLCSVFVDPIESIRMTDNDTFVVALKIPAGVDASANISFGPLGARSCQVVESNGETLTLGRPNPFVGVPDSLSETLVRLGLPTREQGH